MGGSHIGSFGCKRLIERDPERKVLGECAQCHDKIYSFDEYYDMGHELVHWDCLREWAEKYLVR